MRAWAGEAVPGGHAATGGWSTPVEQQPLQRAGEITPIVRPEAQQNPSDPVISESYQGLGIFEAARLIR